MKKNPKKALVTGATSGLGLETVRLLAKGGSDLIIMTGRSAAKAEAARAGLALPRPEAVTTLALDLNQTASIDAAVAELKKQGSQIDLLVLNAGMISGSERRLTEDGIEETFSSTLTGHHVFTMALLANQLLSPDAAIVIAGSEAARGDVPTMGTTDMQSVAARDFSGDLIAAAAAMIRGEVPNKFRANQTYANAKMFVAWWAAALARRLPNSMSVNAVSPGATPDTDAGRHKGFVMRRLMMPMMSAMPNRMQMSGTITDGALRYLQVGTAAESTTGKFYASAPKKMHGPLHQLEIPALVSTELQEAAWQAICETTKRDYPTV